MFTPAEISKNYIAVAKTKTTMRWYKILVLAVLAGAFIALGGALATIAASGIKDGATARLVKGAVFPLGLMLVVVCGAELFTGNCLLAAPLINRDIKLGGTLKNLGIVYLGNLVGGVLIAAIVVGISFMSPEIFINPNVIATTADIKAGLGFGDVLLRGILCNILVCLAVWAAMASKSTVGKIVALYLPVFAFVVCGFEHSVADMYYLAAGLMTGEMAKTFGDCVLCLLSATIGNVIGGALVAIAYNVVYGKRNKKAEAGEGETPSANVDAVSEAAATDDKKE